MGFRIDPSALSFDTRKLAGSGEIIARAANNLLPNSAARDLSRTFNGLMDNPQFREIYQAVVPEGLQNVVGGFFGGDGQDIREMARRSDPLYTFHWKVVMPFGFPPMFVEDIVLPHRRIGVNQTRFANRTRHDPDFVDTGETTMRLYEDRHGSSTSFVENWMDLVEKNGYYGAPYEFKKPIVVVLMDSKRLPVIAAKIPKAWPTGMGDKNVNSQSGQITIDVEFTHGPLYWQFPGQQGFLSNLGVDTSKVFTGNLGPLSSQQANQLLSRGVARVLGF